MRKKLISEHPHVIVFSHIVHEPHGNRNLASEIPRFRQALMDACHECKNAFAFYFRGEGKLLFFRDNIGIPLLEELLRIFFSPAICPET